MMKYATEHPMDSLLRADRMPHIWCPGCGLGSILTCYLEALVETGIDLKYATMVSGIGCAGRAAGYVKIDSFHVTHGRPIPFAIGLKVTDPRRNVTVFSGDGDLFAIGGNHIIHAARRNVDITVICVNNFNYGMTGGQVGPTTPIGAFTTTTPYGNIEPEFNLPHLCASAGAVYVARWTSLHARRLKESIKEALLKRGFCFIEVLSPCPVAFGRRNMFREGIDMMRYFRDKCKIVHGADTRDVGIVLGEEIIIGKFVDIEEKETLHDHIARIQRIAQDRWWRKYGKS
ncbi:MAG: thiamine pyrophosphate-dependent enzyme [Candidatus Asgardarchaeia archaeon]